MMELTNEELLDAYDDLQAELCDGLRSGNPLPKSHYDKDEQLRAELLRRLSGSGAAVLEPKCPEHKVAMVQKVDRKVPFWGCPNDGCGLFISVELLNQVAQFFPASLNGEKRATERDVRQREVSEWCTAAFGAKHASSVPQRGIRMLEEALEAYQSATLGLPIEEMTEKAHALVDYVMNRLAGDLAQECGGVGLTLLALCQSAGISAEAEELREIARVKAKPLEHFHKRNQVKNEAGFEIVAATTQGTPEGK